MAKYTEAQARSAQKYLSKFAEIRIRLKPEEKEIISKDAALAGKSVNQYIIDKLLPYKVVEVPGSNEKE